MYIARAFLTLSVACERGPPCPVRVNVERVQLSSAIKLHPSFVAHQPETLVPGQTPICLAAWCWPIVRNFHRCYRTQPREPFRGWHRAKTCALYPDCPSSSLRSTDSAPNRTRPGSLSIPGTLRLGLHRRLWGIKSKRSH